MSRSWCARSPSAVPFLPREAPDDLDAVLAGGLGGVGVLGDPGEAELGRDAAAGGVRAVVVDLDVVDRGVGEGELAEPAGGLGGDAAARVRGADPVADLQPGR